MYKIGKGKIDKVLTMEAL